MAVCLKLFVVAIGTMIHILYVHCVQMSDDFHDALRKQEVYIKTYSNANQKSMSMLRNQKTKPVFDIYCYEPETSLSILHLWATAHLKIQALESSAQYEVYHGSNGSSVYEQRALNAISTSIVLPKNGFWEIALHPFQKTCSGINTRAGYRLELFITAVNTKLVITFFAGVLLFLFAPVFGRTALTFYVLGMTVGIVASVLIALYLVSRMFLGPKMLAVSVLAGSSLALWAMKMLWTNFAFLVNAHHAFFVTYLIGAIATSFAVCYYRGPPENERFYDLAVWALQACGLVLINAGSQVPELSVAVMVILVLSQTVRWVRSRD